MKFVSIQKAGPKKRKPWKQTRTQARSERLAREIGGEVRVDIVRGIQRFKKKVDVDSVYQAWLSGDYHKIFQSIPWQDLPQEFDDVGDDLAQAGFEASGIAIESLPEPVNSALRYDVENPRIANIFGQQAATMVTGIQEETADLIRRETMRSFTDSRSPREVAEQIRDSIGLLPQHAAAVENYRNGLLASGWDRDKADRMSASYTETLLDYRARMIARTEIQNATNFGQLFVWQEASNQGLIDNQTSKKVWVVDGDPCEICEPMDGVAVGLHESWTLNNGDVVEVPSQSHPHCYCLMELDMGDSEAKTEDRAQGYDEE